MSGSEIETRWTALTTVRGTTGPQPPRCAGSRGRLRSPHHVAPRLQGPRVSAEGFSRVNQSTPTEVFSPRARCTSDARRALRRSSRPHHAPAPAPRARPQQPPRYTGPARPAQTRRTRCTSDARKTLRRTSRPRHAPAPATHARPQQPPRRQLPALPPPAAPATASPRRMMALRHHAFLVLFANPANSVHPYAWVGHGRGGLQVA